MKTEPNDPAFPYVLPESAQEWNPGMSIREHFAIESMKGLLANPAFFPTCTYEGAADDAVKYADALIKELNRMPPTS